MLPLTPGDPRTIGRYRLVGRLGAGGMGVVYKGLSPGGRAVAIKLIHPHLLDRDPSFRSRFRREILAAQRVGGFWTAAVVDGDAEAESPWYASAFIDAPTLHDVVADSGPLDEPRVLRLGAGLAEALGAVHEAGLVHRDLKPTNILIAPDGPRVIDFGIVRVDLGDGGPGTATPTGMVIGTVGYLSPEQLELGTATAASDVFALGALLVFAATGRTPFPGATSAAVILRTMTAPPDLDGVPAGLRGVVERCLDKDPAGRPPVPMLIDELSGVDPPTRPVPVAGGPPDQHPGRPVHGTASGGADPSASRTGAPPAGTRPGGSPAAPPSRTGVPSRTAVDPSRRSGSADPPTRRDRSAGPGPRTGSAGEHRPDPVGSPAPGRTSTGTDGPADPPERWIRPAGWRVLLAGVLLGAITGAVTGWATGEPVLSAVAAVVTVLASCLHIERAARSCADVYRRESFGGLLIVLEVLGAIGYVVFVALELGQSQWWEVVGGGLLGGVVHLVFVLVVGGLASMVDSRVGVLAGAWACAVCLFLAMVLLWGGRMAPAYILLLIGGIGLVTGPLLAAVLRIGVLPVDAPGPGR